LFSISILSLLLLISYSGYSQEDSRIKIVLSVNANGKAITTPLNGVSTSVSRYYDDVVTTPVGTKGKDTTAVKSPTPPAGYKAGVFYLNLDAKSFPDEILKLVAGKNSSFDGTITITDSYGKIPARTIKFFKASLYSFSDQYSSTYYNDSIGSAAISLNCSSISINGILIEQ
jgi:hypothetical protein